MTSLIETYVGFTWSHASKINVCIFNVMPDDVSLSVSLQYICVIIRREEEEEENEVKTVSS